MSALWIVQDNQLTTSELPTPIQDLMSPPYPAGVWYESEDNTLITRVLPELVEGPLSPPYPSGIWYKNENNELETRSLPDKIKMGAFLGCTNLSTVNISKTVKYIGEFAFADTALTTVTIARDCTYFPTSFPPDCHVNFYPEEE